LKKNTLAVIYALLAVAMWSTVATAFKLSLQHLSLLQLLTGASFISLMVLSAFLISRAELSIAIETIPKNIKTIVVLALLNPVLYYLVLFRAYELLPAHLTTHGQLP
jgi:drug/metabolite transporter (DMT)-like permease